MDLQQLAAMNPWWRSPQEIKQDPKIVDVSKSQLRWIPGIVDSFSLENDHIYTLRGPRQVGKTTLVKLIIKRLLLEKGVNPRSVFYYTCDGIFDHEELIDAIRTYIAFSSPTELPRSYVFVDEISSVKNWERAVKLLADSGELSKKTIILTGSHSLDLKYSAERLPGRRGEGEDTVNKVMFPMRFSEYVFTVREDLRDPLRMFYRPHGGGQLDTLRKLVEGNIDSGVINELVLYQKELRALFDDYILTGGIIRPVSEFFKAGPGSRSIRSTTYELYIRSVIGDLARWRYQENIAKQVLRSVVNKMTTRVSLNSIAKENEIGSHNTVSSYLEALEDSFVLSILYPMALDDGMPIYRKEKKVYFSDPFFYHAARSWARGEVDYFQAAQKGMLDPVEKSRLVEMIVASHLTQLSCDLAPSDVTSHHERLMFARTKKGYEVDFVLKQGGDLFPVEVKYQDSVGKRDLVNLFSMGKGILVSKSTISAYGKYATVPAEIFLMLT